MEITAAADDNDNDDGDDMLFKCNFRVQSSNRGWIWNFFTVKKSHLGKLISEYHSQFMQFFRDRYYE